MKSKILISREEFENYLRLKKIEKDAKSQIFNSIQDLREDRIY
ncbi:MAG: hypothetical protein ACMXYB_03015 [Candidatus Woesearchaeota archaeon]